MKNGVYSEFKVFAGNGNRPLADEIAKLMGGTLGIADVKQFSDGEVAVNIQESSEERIAISYNPHLILLMTT